MLFSLALFFMLKPNSLSEDVCEQAISPFTSVGVQGSIQVVFTDGLGVNYVSHTLNTLQPL